MSGRGRSLLSRSNALGYATPIPIREEIVADEHILASNWKEADAVALEERVIAVTHWLDHTEDLIKMLETDEKIVTSLRGMAGTLRSRKNDFESAANKLRAEINDLNGKQT